MTKDIENGTLYFHTDPFAESKKYFKTPLQEFQFFDKYSRFNREKGRRETWKETVKRTIDYLKKLSENKLTLDEYNLIEESILKMEVMPSMRLLAMAGPAAERDPISIYNCAYIAVNELRAFTDILRLSMSGVGIGFSVEQRHVGELPFVKPLLDPLCEVFVVEDSTAGWVNALKFGLNRWFNGQDVRFDYSKIRPAGTELKVKGGVASGPDPLRKLLDFTRETILRNPHKKLTTLQVYDIVCMIGNCVVSGGVRRVAFLCLFDCDDVLMLNAKSQNALKINPHRYYSNNSAVLPERKLTQAEVMRFVLQMDKDGNGEPGMFSRLAIANTIPERRKTADFGVNACAESILRNKGLCNLSSVICRENDTFLDLSRKVRVATMIGTIQSMATEFNGFDETWSKNAREERLLGVDLNAQMDCAEVRKETTQQELKRIAIDANSFYSKCLGIEESAAVTLVKPSGNSGVLLDVSSGLHPRWSHYYIRNVRVNRESPLCLAMKTSGVKMSPENGQTEEDATSYVVSFPSKSPDSAIVRSELTALDQCNYWKQVKLNWCEHNPSVTVYYDENEILDVAKWIYENQGIISGMAFLPRMDATYEQAPYIEITKEEYEKLNAEFPVIDFSLLPAFEKKDETTGSQQVACSAGSCDLHL